jgi:hypothetical protein
LFNIDFATCPHCGHSCNTQDGPAKCQAARASNGRSYEIISLLPQDHRLDENHYALLVLRNNEDKVFIKACDKDMLLYRKAKTKLIFTNGLQITEIDEMPVKKANKTDQVRNYNY